MARTLTVGERAALVLRRVEGVRLDLARLRVQVVELDRVDPVFALAPEALRALDAAGVELAAAHGQFASIMGRA